MKEMDGKEGTQSINFSFPWTWKDSPYPRSTEKKKTNKQKKKQLIKQEWPIIAVADAFP